MWNHNRSSCPIAYVRSAICDGKEENTKRRRITPSRSSPNATVDLEVDRLVGTLIQSPLASSMPLSPRRSPRFKEAAAAAAGAPCNIVAAVSKKQNVLGFKLDNKTIYAWFCEDLEPLSSSTSSSLLKKKAQNNFGRIQHKERLVEVQDDGKSLRIASNTKNENPKSKPRRVKKGPPTAASPSSISLTYTIESNSYRRYLIEDFLYAKLGDHLVANCLGSSPICFLLKTLQPQRAEAFAPHLRSYLHTDSLQSNPPLML
jgi:hypothetical protein